MNRFSLFCHQHPTLGRVSEVFIIVLSSVSIALLLLMSETIVVIGVTTGLTLLNSIMFLVYILTDKLRRSLLTW